MCIKNGAMGMLIAGLLLAVSVCPSFAAVQEVQTFVDSTWTNEIYYMASLSGYYGKTVGYDDIKVKITAIDEYTLYINGVEIGSDNNWETVEEYTVNLGGKNIINVVVKVINHGLGLGNGLIMDITGGSDQLGTWTKLRDSIEVKGEYLNVPVAWWTCDVVTKKALGWGDDWYKFDNTRFTDQFITARFVVQCRVKWASSIRISARKWKLLTGICILMWTSVILKEEAFPSAVSRVKTLLSANRHMRSSSPMATLRQGMNTWRNLSATLNMWTSRGFTASTR